MSDDRYRLYQQAFPTGDYSFMQLAFVVDDVEAAAHRWVEAHGVGPFFVLPDNGPARVVHRGVETQLHTRIAVTQTGPLQIELVQQLSDNASVFRDLYGSGEGGAHHLCTLVADYDASVAHYAGLGYELAAEQYAPGLGRVGYIDTAAGLGVMTELVERSPAFLAMLAKTASICATWDGTHPVRLPASRPVVSAAADC
jgi:Glyoxalase/Bleomycin resistance protein/Dioxygenase superfamily